eukprot:177001-Amphidinium_carterae.3
MNVMPPGVQNVQTVFTYAQSEERNPVKRLPMKLASKVLAQPCCLGQCRYSTWEQKKQCMGSSQTRPAICQFGSIYYSRMWGDQSNY